MRSASPIARQPVARRGLRATEVPDSATATVTKEPVDADFFEGRDAYFRDPEGNYWEIAWAPAAIPSPLPRGAPPDSPADG